jgi:hypothetical protein
MNSTTTAIEFLKQHGFPTAPEEMARLIIERLSDAETLQSIREATDPDTLLLLLECKGPEFYEHIIANKYCDNTILTRVWQSPYDSSIGRNYLVEIVAHPNASQELISEIQKECDDGGWDYDKIRFLIGLASNPSRTSDQLVGMWNALDSFSEESEYFDYLEKFHLAIISNPSLTREDVLQIDVSEEDEQVLRAYAQRVAFKK